MSGCTVCIPGNPCSRHLPPVFTVGDPVRIRRTAPARGTWPRHDGKPGFVVIVSEGAGPAGEPEYGVIETTTVPQWRREPGREHEVHYDSESVFWFTPHELERR